MVFGKEKIKKKPKQEKQENMYQNEKKSGYKNDDDDWMVRFSLFYSLGCFTVFH